MKQTTQKASLIGSILAGFLASICCIGPIVFAILGVSGLSFIQHFEEYRSLFIIVAVVLLGIAFYLTYKKAPAEDCAPGSYCASPKSDRLNKIILWCSTVLIGLSIFFPDIVSKLNI